MNHEGSPQQIISDIAIEHDNNQMEVDDENPTIDHVQKPKQIIGDRLNKAPKTSAERGREFRARKALLKQQSKQQQKPDAIVEIATEDIRSAGSSEDNQVLGPSEIRTIEKRAKSAEATRRWREKKKGASESSEKQTKTAAQRMREYRERKKLAKKILLKQQSDQDLDAIVGTSSSQVNQRAGRSTINSISAELTRRGNSQSQKTLWLLNLNKPDLINVNISKDRRICEKHFSHDMIGKSKQRLKRKAIPLKGERMIFPAKRVPIFQADQLIPPTNSEGIEIGANYNEEVKVEPETMFIDSTSSLIFPTTHKGTEIITNFNADVKDEPESSNDSEEIGTNCNEDIKDEPESSNASTTSIIFPTTYEGAEIETNYNEDVKVEPEPICNEGKTSLIFPTTFKGAEVGTNTNGDVKVEPEPICNEGKTSLIFPTTYKGAEIGTNYNGDVKVEPESVYNEGKTSLIFPTTYKGAEIGINYNAEVKVEPQSVFNEGKTSLIFPTIQNSIQTISVIGNSEDEVNKLREECEELRKQVNELRKEIDSDAFYIEKSRRILPAELARIVEEYLNKSHH